MFRLLIIALLGLASLPVRAQETQGSLTALIEKNWKDISNGKGPKVPFSAPVVMAPDSDELVAIQSWVPKTGETFANTHILMSCVDKSGALTPTRKPHEKGPKFFQISGSLSDLQIPTDTGAYESNTLARFAVMIENCDVKDRTVTPDEAVAGRNIALMNTKAVYPGPTFSCADLSKCSPLAQVILAEAQSSFQLGLADIALVQPYQALRHAKPDDQKVLREQASRFAQNVEKTCKLTKKFLPDEAHGNLVGTDKFAACVKDAYAKQRIVWADQVQALANSDATDEINRPSQEHYFLQLLLAYQVFLTTDAKIDGSYGSGTRTAIIAVQKEAQMPETGFMSAATATYLTRRIDRR